MKILITGINGFVGKALYAVLRKNHEVYGLYNSDTELFDNCFKCDLTNYQETELIFEKLKHIDVIIHLASQMANANNIHDLSVLNANSAMSKNTALLGKKYLVKHIINLSSSSVYPNIDGIYNEMALPNPSLNSDCIYGLSKLNSEMIFNFFLLKSNIIVTHLRVAMIYGDGMNASRIMPVIEKEIEDTNTVTLFGNGERLLNLIHVDKLVNYISYFINKPLNTTVNVGDECISLLNLAKQIIGKKGNELTKIVLKEEGNKTQFVLDTKKLKNIYNV